MNDTTKQLAGKQKGSSLTKMWRYSCHAKIKKKCSRVTGVFILIGSFGMFLEVMTMDMILGNVNFQIVFFLIFSNICCTYIMKLPL